MRSARDAGASRAIAYHERLAKGWSARYAGGGFKRRADFFVAEVLPLIAPRGDWIDVGCGSGVFTRILALGGASVLGVDGSEAMIEAARAARQEVGAAPPRYEARTIETLATEEATFDGILCFSVLEYLDDPAAAMATLANLSRPGGTLVLSVPNRGSATRRLQSAIRCIAKILGSDAFPYLASSRNAWSRRGLVALANKAGFSCDKICGFDPILPRALARFVSPSLWFLVCRKPR